MAGNTNKVLGLIGSIRELYPDAYQVDNGENNFRLWESFYRGEPYYLDEMDKDGEVATLQLPHSISSELARLTTLELSSSIDKEDNNTTLTELDENYQEVVNDARAFVEYGLALGSIILKPYPIEVGSYFDDESGQDIMVSSVEVEYVTPDRFVPIKFNNRKELVHVVFIDQVRVIDEHGRKWYYTRLEEHERTDKVRITNTVYKSETANTVGELADINEVEEWVGMAEEVEIEVDYNLYGFFTNPMPNPWNYNDPSGLSCFATSINLIQDADEQYRRIKWEYEGSELALDVDQSAIPKDGTIPKGKQRLFRKFIMDTGREKSLYSVFSPNIRANDQFQGLNEILMKIEFKCGLAYGTLSHLEDKSVQTATEIKSSKQRSYATVTDIQKKLNQALNEVVRAMAFWLGIKGDFTLSSDFDDSLISDKDTEREFKLKQQAELRNDVLAGLLSPEKYIELIYEVSSEMVTEYLPGNSIIDPPEE